MAIYEVTMPKLGETDADTFTLEKWLVIPGQRIRQGHPLLVAGTDKTSIEVESRYSGVVRLLIGAEGAQIPVGSVVALIGHSRDRIPAAYSKLTGPRVGKTRKRALQKKTKTPTDTETNGLPAASNSLPASPVRLPNEGTPPISPRARRRMRQLNLPQSSISLPPEGKRITERDVLNSYARLQDVATAVDADGNCKSNGSDMAPAGRLPAERIPLGSLRRTIAESMSYSQQWIPQFSVDMFVAARPLLELRTRLKEEWGKKQAPRLDDFFIVALSRVLLEERFRPFRAVLDGNDWVVRGHINIGFAVSVDDSGVVVPVIKNADRYSLRDLVPMTQDLTFRARQRHLRPAEYSGGLLTVSNLGDTGVCAFRAMVRPGESAILAVPASQVRAKADVQVSGLEEVWQLSLAADHRLIDGALAGKFLTSLKNLVEYPDGLLL